MKKQRKINNKSQNEFTSFHSNLSKKPKEMKKPCCQLYLPHTRIPYDTVLPTSQIPYDTIPPDHQLSLESKS